MRNILIGLALTVALSTGATAQSLPARLERLAVWPAESFVAPPANAGPDLAQAGAYAGPARARETTLGAIPDPRGARGLPVRGQPVQGFSEAIPAAEGGYWMLADNGFGSRRTSADAMLMIHRMVPDGARLRRAETVFLSDPNQVFPYPLQRQGTAQRYLTGADLDPESLAVVGQGRALQFWVGEEFGPSILAFDRQGRLVRRVEVSVEGAAVRSPDHWSLDFGGQLPGLERRIDRSRGFEGMAYRLGPGPLYPLLEGPLRDSAGVAETRDGAVVLRLLELDPAAGTLTGRHWLYPLAAADHAIGAIQWIAPGRALVIERDNREGAAATFKRVFVVEVDLGAPGSLMRKGAYVDLLAIHDPGGIAGPRGEGNGQFRFPFQTIESIVVLGPDRIGLINDNNYPFSAGRDPTRRDDSEWIELSVPGLFGGGG